MPLRRRALKPGQALLVGRLDFAPATRTRDAELRLSIWCPYCRREHEHGWGDPPFRLDVVEHRTAHCSPGSPLARDGYFIGADPSHEEHNRDQAKKMKAWLVQQQTQQGPHEACVAAVNEGPPSAALLGSLGLSDAKPEGGSS